MSILVNLNQVNKFYQTPSGRFHALKNIHFQIQRGERVAIIGASGSGKSTLMNIIGFLDRIDSGCYTFDGQDFSNLKKTELAIIRNKKIGFVFQSFFLLPRLTVLQNVMLPLFYRESEKNQSMQQALAMLQRVDMDRYVNQRPNQLSGGQQQRVAIARALVTEPEIILADEPTGALDSKTGQAVLDLLVKLNEVEGRTVVIITHDKQVSQQCQRVVTIKDGQIDEEITNAQMKCEVNRA